MLSETATNWLALGVLAALALAGAAWLLREFARTAYTLPQFTLFVMNTVVARLLWRARTSGPLPVGAGQGAVIVSNHIGPFDPSFIALEARRPVHWMVAKEYCELPAVSWFFKTVEAIPTTRAGIDTAATKLAIRYARQGDLVGMFPEGRINETDQLLLPGRPGAALIALRARVPVIPCYLTDSPNDGTLFGFLFTPARAQLLIGRAIDLTPYYDRASDKEVQRELTLRFLSEIAKLAGHPDFQPELAGKRWSPNHAETVDGNR